MVALLLIVMLIPLFTLLTIIIWIEDRGSPIFFQERVGFGGRVFKIYKFRTMIFGAEHLVDELEGLNDADGPAFKIFDDPRFTRVGKVISKLALDELPQLINIIKGDMLFVGPRPLPTSEAREIPSNYQKRQSVYPGMTSKWVVQGRHSMSFKRWMEIDLEYVRNNNYIDDIRILLETLKMILRIMFGLI